MGKALLWFTFAFAMLVVASTTSRGDVGSGSGGDIAKPPVIPAQSIGQTSAGPPGSTWSYDQIDPEEQAYVDRNRDVTGWAHIGDEITKAAVENAQRAQAQTAQIVLGIPNLATEGVVP